MNLLTRLICTSFVLCTLIPNSIEISNRRIAFKRIGRSKREVIACPAGLDFRSPGIRVFLTVSPLATTSGSDERIIERQLELNWFNRPNEHIVTGDWVGLFDHDPTVNPLDPLERVTVANHPEGRFKTSVSYPRPDLRITDLTVQIERRCLGYWIGYVHAGRTIAMDCLKMQPTWMYDLRNDIGHLKIRELMLPGTHDSGSYDEFKGKNSQDVFTRWVLTQDEPFWEQLMYGVRAFDIRMGFYSETPQLFWLNHNFVRVNPFQEAVDDLKIFLNRTQEIILLDFHRFPVGYTNRPERHAQLLEFLINQFGDHILDRNNVKNYDVTLDDVWRSGKRLIIAYSDKFYATSPLLWPPIPQVWANTRDPQALFHHLRASMNDPHVDFWSSMAELTPSTLEILLSNGSLRLFADAVDQNVTNWFRDLWWNDANIVSVDFFLATNIIDVVIESNLKRKLCHDAITINNGRTRTRNNNLPQGNPWIPPSIAQPFQPFLPIKQREPEPPANVGPRTVTVNVGVSANIGRPSNDDTTGSWINL